MNPISLVVHGGGGVFRPEVLEDCRAALQRALQRGWAILKEGGPALEACEAAIVELEDEPLFDAALGSHLNRDGKVQMDAILMDGGTLKAGAVCAVERIRNPIRLARLVLERSEHVLLAADGAEEFALENGMNLCDPHELITKAAFSRWSAQSEKSENFGTVGAVALDRAGALFAGTSTGGTFFKYPGRVGDSPLIGCGCYADARSAAVSCTGHGESIMKIVMAKKAADLVESGSDAQSSADEAVRILEERTGGGGGLIVVDTKGRVGAAFSTPTMAWGAITSVGGILIHV